MTATVPVPPTHQLPPPFSSPASTRDLTLISQGAEALLYHTPSYLTPNHPAALKFRPPKPYRHPTLDKRLTRQRTLAEVRVLVKLRKEGVGVPGVLGVDVEGGVVVVEWVAGVVVKEVIRTRSGGDEGEVKGLLRRIGEAVGKLHKAGVVHGDLTTSNMMLRPSQSGSSNEQHEVQESAINADSKLAAPTTALDGDIILIDFGLASQTVQEEERAVDLYVLERAFGSTHPKEEEMFGVVLEAYEKSYKGGKGGDTAFERR